MKVDAIDGSVELCKIAQKYTGINVRPMLFQQLDEEEKYDGIWACSSILHLPKKELKSVFEKMLKALKKVESSIHLLKMEPSREKEMEDILQTLQYKILENLFQI